MSSWNSTRIVLAGLAAFLVSASAAFLFANYQGVDVDQARAEGAATGSASGAQRGELLGYRSGYRRAFTQTRKRSYSSTKRRVVKAGAAEASKVAPINRSCGNMVDEGAGSYSVQAQNLVCDLARQVVVQWEMHCSTGTCSVPAGFSCSYRDGGIELVHVTCIDGERVVRFDNGA